MKIFGQDNKYRIKYIWDMRKIANSSPEVIRWFNNLIMGSVRGIDGEEVGELFDISDLSWSEEEAKHIKAQLDELDIPSAIYVGSEDELENLVNFANESDRIGEYAAANRFDMQMQKIACK